MNRDYDFIIQALDTRIRESTGLDDALGYLLRHVETLSHHPNHLIVHQSDLLNLIELNLGSKEHITLTQNGCWYVFKHTLNLILARRVGEYCHFVPWTYTLGTYATPSLIAKYATKNLPDYTPPPYARTWDDITTCVCVPWRPMNKGWMHAPLPPLAQDPEEMQTVVENAVSMYFLKRNLLPNFHFSLAGNRVGANGEIHEGYVHGTSIGGSIVTSQVKIFLASILQSLLGDIDPRYFIDTWLKSDETHLVQGTLMMFKARGDTLSGHDKMKVLSHLPAHIIDQI